MDALASALKQIEANAQAEAAFQLRLKLDARYQFLLSTAKANDIQFDESHYGAAGLNHLVSYHQTGAPYRRQRAKALLSLRRAFLFNGYRGMGKKLDEITRYRRTEKLDRILGTLTREHEAGMVGATAIQMKNEAA